MQENELIELVDKVTVLMEKYHRNTDKVGQTYAQSAQRLQQVIETCPRSVDKAISDGIGRFEESSQRATTQMLASFQKKMDDLHRINKILAWKMAAMISVAALVLVIGCVFLLPHYVSETQRYKVGADIMRLYQNSDTTLCQDQLCGKLSRNGKKGEYVPIDLK